jgi:hypothetical protein
MNETPFAGYWFYGAASASELASFYCSYGLIQTAPQGVVYELVSKAVAYIYHLFSPRLSKDYTPLTMLSRGQIKI